MGVWPDEEDDPVGGPVPDPSERTWRHPSELAAGFGPAPSASPSASEIAVMVDGPGRSPVRSASMLGGCLAVAALGVAALYLVASPSSLTQAVGSEGRSGPPDPSGIDRAISDAIADAFEASAPDAVTAAADLDAADRAGQIASAEIVPTPDASPGDDLAAFTDSSDALRSDQSDSATSATSAGPPPATVYAEPDEWVSTVGPGVFTSRRAGEQPVAGITMVDGMIVTSASAVDRLADVFLSLNGRWIVATVVSTDPVTDLALLAVEDETADLTNPFGPPGPAVLVGATVRIGVDAMETPDGPAPTEPLGEAEGLTEAGRWPGSTNGDSDDDSRGDSAEGNGRGSANRGPNAGGRGNGTGAASGNSAPSEQGQSGGGSDTEGGITHAIGMSGKVFAIDGDETLPLIRSSIPYEPGYGGLPLLDRQGRMVGVIVNGTASHNVNAVPITTALQFVRAVQAADATAPVDLGFLTVDDQEGRATVFAVERGGPAEGVLQRGDRILSIGQVDPVDSVDSAALIEWARLAGSGAEIEIEIERAGRRFPARLTLG